MNRLGTFGLFLLAILATRLGAQQLHTTPEYVDPSLAHLWYQEPRYLESPSFSNMPTCCQWTTPVFIDTSAPNLYEQLHSVLAVDGSGNLVAAWLETLLNGQRTFVVEGSTNTGQTWLRSEPFGVEYFRHARDFAFDSVGNLWLLSTTKANEFAPYFLNLSQSTDYGQTFTTVFTSREYAAPYFESKLAIGPSNDVFILWDDQQFKLTRFVNGNITHRIDTEIPNDTLRVDFWCSVAVSRENLVYATWTGVRRIGSGQDIYKIYCSSSPDTGRTFPFTVRVDTTEFVNSYSVQRYPGSHVDKNSLVHISYMRMIGIPDSNSILVATSSTHGVSFNQPVIVVELGTNTMSSLSGDAANGLNILWAGENGATFSRSTDKGSSFTVPYLIGFEGVGTSNALKADSFGNLFAIFETLRRAKFARTNVLAKVENDGQVISTMPLFQNYPNPFNDATTIEFNILFAADVSLYVFDILGRPVDRLLNTHLPPGLFSYRWNPANISSGVYLLRLELRDRSTRVVSLSRRLVYMR